MEQEKRIKRAKAERAAKQRKARRRKRIFFLAGESVIFLLLLYMLFASVKYEKLQGYLWGNSDYKTIAVFGVDSKEGNLGAGAYSDTMMLISIHPQNKEVKVVSVYRNLLTMQADGTIRTAKEAYFHGGPQEAMDMLNKNFDLAISDYVSVDYTAVADLIDLLGGLEWTLTEDEAAEMNLHMKETAALTGNTVAEVKSGLQILDGVKGLTYMRICKNVGGDIARTKRQEMMVTEILKKVQKAQITTVDKIIGQIFTKISTSLTLKECMSLAVNGIQCKSMEMKSYAFEYKEDSVQDIKNAIIPLGVKENVNELHAFLYEGKDYHMTLAMKKTAQEIESFSGYSREDYEETE